MVPRLSDPIQEAVQKEPQLVLLELLEPSQTVGLRHTLKRGLHFSLPVKADNVDKLSCAPKAGWLRINHTRYSCPRGWANHRTREWVNGKSEQQNQTGRSWNHFKQRILPGMDAHLQSQKWEAGAGGPHKTTASSQRGKFKATHGEIYKSWASLNWKHYTLAMVSVVREPKA